MQIYSNLPVTLHTVFNKNRRYWHLSAFSQVDNWFPQSILTSTYNISGVSDSHELYPSFPRVPVMPCHDPASLRPLSCTCSSFSTWFAVSKLKGTVTFRRRWSETEDLSGYSGYNHLLATRVEEGEMFRVILREMEYLMVRNGKKTFFFGIFNMRPKDWSFTSH